MFKKRKNRTQTLLHVAKNIVIIIIIFVSNELNSTITTTNERKKLDEPKRHTEQTKADVPPRSLNCSQSSLRFTCIGMPWRSTSGICLKFESTYIGISEVRRGKELKLHVILECNIYVEHSFCLFFKYVLCWRVCQNVLRRFILLYSFSKQV